MWISTQGAAPQQLPEGHAPRQGYLGSRHKCHGLRCSSLVEWARARQVREFLSAGGSGPPPGWWGEERILRRWPRGRIGGVIAGVLVFHPW